MNSLTKGQRADWQTTLSQAKSIVFTGLHDDGTTLTMIFVADEKCKVTFKWKNFCAYRNTLEEHRLPWDLSLNTPDNSGPTNIVENSAWISELRANNDLLDLLQQGVRHYVIGNDIYTTEIISNIEPEILVTNC